MNASTQISGTPQELALILAETLKDMVKVPKSITIPDDVEYSIHAAAKIFAAHYTKDKITSRSKVLARIGTIGSESKMHMTMGDIRLYIENNSRFI